MTIDIKNFYLNTPMERFEYMRLGGDGAALVKFDGEQGNGGRATVAGIHDAVPSHCQARSSWVVFCWSEAHHDASIRDISPAVGWDVLLLDEEYRVGAFDSSRHALGEAPKFVAV